MDIGTAKVSAAEQALISHHGLDLVDPDAAFTAADYRRHALAALEGIADRARTALLVGGTGLYLRVVARGLPVDAAGHDPAIRARLEARIATDGLAALASELQQRAPGAAQEIDLANPRRVVRALERLEATGLATPPEPVGYPAPLLWVGLAREPADHAAAIAERVRWQFASGLLDEAASLRERYGEKPRAFDAIGYREAFDVLAGRATLEQSIERATVRTRAYAKRQRTWFRSEPDITWLSSSDPFADALRTSSEFLGRAQSQRSNERIRTSR
jgi:tRNA dimethylallyltransferase